MSHAKDSRTLAEALAASLPASLELRYHHLSVPPTQCSDIFAPGAGRQPRKTYCESHSLTVTTRPEGSPPGKYVAIFAIELILYTTAQLSTLFVSKADSTGFASLLKVPQGSGSVVRNIATIFISWLVRVRHRPDRRLVLSLFARAQDQYLFPGSVENPTKHVLDDRELIRWWCKTLDPIAKEYTHERTEKPGLSIQGKVDSKAYLIVPGLDRRETAAFFPPANTTSTDGNKWVNDHPLQLIANRPTDPPRCLVPRFPDDPKARFLDDLDEELPSASSSQQQNKLVSPSKRGVGHWKSVRTLEQFWEMMAYRQECSSGRLVGFIWITFTPCDLGLGRQLDRSVSPSPIKRKANDGATRETTSKPVKVPHRKRPLTGTIHSRAPRVKTTHESTRNGHGLPEVSKSYFSPAGTRGTLILDQKAYDRVHEILLRLDFAGLETAVASTSKWVLETATVASALTADWGVDVVGTKPVPSQSLQWLNGGQAAVNILPVNKKRKKGDSAEPTGTHASATTEPDDASIKAAVGAGQAAGVNVLGSGLVRKKVKTAP